jgi:hypothetical protein
MEVKNIDYEKAKQLPEGKTCSSCFHFNICREIGFTWDDRNNCDFYPNKYKETK